MGEHLIIYLAFFMNHMSHATKDNETCDMYQNSGRTKGPVTCDWTNQSKWYSNGVCNTDRSSRRFCEHDVFAEIGYYRGPPSKKS
jgi:hypothetical protein